MRLLQPLRPLLLRLHQRHHRLRWLLLPRLLLRHNRNRPLLLPRHELLERCLRHLLPLPRLRLKLPRKPRVLQLPLHLLPLLQLRRLPQWQMLLLLPRLKYLARLLLR